ncbi:hypothetical protein BZG02_09690 [Labilibaculum filiforme]|uniref:Uncharacterized protein n=1 Tax=Labilibaculum filiforme TaxID=1940526 RepID=A0A2N3HYA1_9BACT|nr:hypothetical protein [Labilibaculum filiforme]PKQ63034.1 hypothetical protein BZG02_09690 [Labilibaculum filiforme]
MSSPVIFGGYLIYKYGKWVYERMAYGDKKEEEISLSPFPIANPVVSHWNRYIWLDIKLSPYLYVKKSKTEV